ncbi:MAG: septation protein SpoVG family protein [Candidatus Thorarchaeota archaeon]
MKDTTSTIKPVRLKPCTKGKVKAFVDVDVADLFRIRSIKVVEGDNGLFVSMPQSKSKTGDRWYDNVSCLSEAVKDDVELIVLKYYKSEVK